MKKFDYLIVGAGFSGSVVAERLASQRNKKVLLIDKRNHIGGNAHDYYNGDGVLVHKYGPHIFHTNSIEVLSYLSQFTEWQPYEHRVLTSVDGQLLPFPINRNTINKLYGLNLTNNEVESFFIRAAQDIAAPKNSKEKIVSQVGEELYDKFFAGYTLKQWGMCAEELSPSVTGRIPIRADGDDRYFTDKYQAIPLRGYTKMFERMLDHPNIKIMLNADYHEVAGYVDFTKLIYTGPIDEYFNYELGRLDYRSMAYDFATYDCERKQVAATINYPNDNLFTRATEIKQITGQQCSKTVIIREYPQADGEPYYPVPTQRNADLYNAYAKAAATLPDVVFMGRLGSYKYYNMDQVVAQALMKIKQF